LGYFIEKAAIITLIFVNYFPLHIMKNMVYYPIFDTWKTKKSCGPLP